MRRKGAWCQPRRCRGGWQGADTSERRRVPPSPPLPSPRAAANTNLSSSGEHCSGCVTPRTPKHGANVNSPPSWRTRLLLYGQCQQGTVTFNTRAQSHARNHIHGGKASPAFLLRLWAVPALAFSCIQITFPSSEGQLVTERVGNGDHLACRGDGRGPGPAQGDRRAGTSRFSQSKY